MDWLTVSLLIFFSLHIFSLHLFSMKSWQELLLQEITPAPGCLMESPTRPEFRVYTLLLRTFGEIFKARKKKGIAPQKNPRLARTVFCPEGDTEVQGICEPFSKGLFAFLSPIGQWWEEAPQVTSRAACALWTPGSRQLTTV